MSKSIYSVPIYIPILVWLQAFSYRKLHIKF